MQNEKCDCSQCENWESCEIKIVVNYPYRDDEIQLGYRINKGDKIGQLILCRHEGWLLPSEYTKDEERTGGFGSTGA